MPEKEKLKDLYEKTKDCARKSDKQNRQDLSSAGRRAAVKENAYRDKEWNVENKILSA
jgi:hypothetical protein